MRKLIDCLWEGYQGSLKDVVVLMNALKNKGVHSVTLDHFAVIDLPSKNSGIPVFSKIFSEFGYEFEGADYLPDKQNDFSWFVAENLPQVVIADFRLDEMPLEIKLIIEKYAAQIPEPSMRAGLEYWLKYFSGRDWSLPTVNEYKTVREFNELLAWVLLFGRIPNHFGLSVHLMEKFSKLDEFIHFVENEAKLPMNAAGGVIKGTPAGGIIQASTMGKPSLVKLADGEEWVPERFVEFVWRYPHKPTGFIANQADYVIESVFNS